MIFVYKIKNFFLFFVNLNKILLLYYYLKYKTSIQKLIISCTFGYVPILSLQYWVGNAISWQYSCGNTKSRSDEVKLHLVLRDS